MKFTIAGSKVICSRIDQTVEGSNRYRDVEGLTEELGTVRPQQRTREDEAPIRGMRPMEILKERLGHIKQDLG